MQEAMRNLYRHLCDLDLASGDYDVFLNRIGSGWSWKNYARTKYKLNGPFATFMQKCDYQTAEKYLTGSLRVCGRQMHAEALQLGLDVVANDIKICCQLAGISC